MGKKKDIGGPVHIGKRKFWSLDDVVVTRCGLRWKWDHAKGGEEPWGTRPTCQACKDAYRRGEWR